jgi:multidrug efflux pump subunit AcrB
MLRHPWVSLVLVVAVFAGSMQLQRFIPALFFPPSERPFLRAKLTFPPGTPIERTEAMVEDLEKFFEDSLITSDEREEGITNWASFIGAGAPRFYLAINPEPQKEELAYLMVNATSREVADEMRLQIEDFLWNRYPDLDAVILPLDYGPPVVAPVEIRLSGKDTGRLFAIVDEVKRQLGGIQGTKNIKDDWGPRVKKLMVVIDQPRARRAGVSSLDISISLQSILSGITVTEFRENEDVIPVVMRAGAAYSQDIGKLETLDVYSQASGRPVPLKQVADIVPEWEPSKIQRRDRIKTVTVSAFLKPGVTAASVVSRIAPWLDGERQNWPLGYSYEFGGELESSVEAQQAIMAKLPIAFGTIILLLVGQFNSFRRSLIVLLTIPLALIGVNIGLVIGSS